MTLVLDGIIVADYLQWVRDADPPSLGRELRHIAVHAAPLGAHIRVELLWAVEPPSTQAALCAAGFPVNPAVTGVIEECQH